MSNQIPTNNNVPSMIPNDPKVWKPTEAMLASLGTNNYLAYHYYEGLRVLVAETKEIWEWREVAPGEENTGLVGADFTYPAGVTLEGIDYSNRTFNFFKVLQASDISLPTITVYDANNVGAGAKVYKDTTGTGPVTFNFRTLVKEALGIGEELIDSIEVQGDTVVVKGKTIGTTNLNIYVAPDGTLMIDSPVSSTNLSFYVDVNSTADTETGTQAAPFKTLNKALDTFIGTGTWYNPQYKGYKITLLSNCTLLETAGADYNGYVNLDINNLDIEGNDFYMSLNANPSPDYYPISTRMVADMPKTANVLDYEIQLNFSNVIIQRVGTNAIVDHLNYSFPTVNLGDPLAPQQPGSTLSLKNVILTNNTDRQEATNPDWVLVPGVTYFGAQIYVSNTAPIGAPMLKTEGRSWNKEGYLLMNNVSLENSTGTNFKASNTTLQIDGRTVMNRRNRLRYYDTVVDDYYSPKTGLYYIEIDDNTNFCEFQELLVGITIPSLLSTETQPRTVAIGGSESMMKITNNSTVSVRKGRTEEQYWNMFQFDGTSFPVLNTFSDSGSNSEDIHGVFKVITPLPVTARSLNASNTILNQVITDETGVDKSYIQYLNGYNNKINNAPHSTYQSYANDTAAKAAGLIKGNVYFNTTIGGLKIVI